ncbi:cytochrome-c peroxidase [Bauldia sp.]|uniref:cytochrome-c peroxidase n=1 Tax=Bauldia sp. TaxID=2575872 RepID=UPI003BA9210A
MPRQSTIRALRSIALFGVAIACFSVAASDRPANLPAPLTDADFPSPPTERVALGRHLFFDPILSGNRNISCATCHHPDHASGDGVPLSIGEGGAGLGPERLPLAGDNRPEQRIGRNAPPLFNLGARPVQVLFHDGRLEVEGDGDAGFRTPLGDSMVEGFSGLLAAQAMFPVISGDEMAGHYGENEISRAVRKGEITGAGGAWDLIAKRVAAVPEYAERFVAAYDHIERPDEIRFTDVANAIADFIAFEWRATDSPFDAYLAGDDDALTPKQKAGMMLFYGKAGCADCHSGNLLTDQGFHSIATPQFGPGRTARFESRAVDLGRMRVTGNPDDAYRFRTPTLRNVAATAPYGHTGAFATLDDVVRHHLSAATSFEAWTPADVILPDFPEATATDWAMHEDDDERARIVASLDLEPVTLSEKEVADLIAFLESLTDEDSLDGRLGRPDRVPSGLPFD